MNPTGSAHVGPFKAREVDDPDQVADRQRLHCAHRSTCLRDAGDRHWAGFACVSPAGEHCEAYERADLADLRTETIALSAFAQWFVSGAEVDGPLETVRAALKASPGASISEISRKTGSSRAFIAKVKRGEP